MLRPQTVFIPIKKRQPKVAPENELAQQQRTIIREMTKWAHRLNRPLPDHIVKVAAAANGEPLANHGDVIISTNLNRRIGKQK